MADFYRGRFDFLLGRFDSLGGRFDFRVGRFDPDTLAIGRFDQPPINILMLHSPNFHFNPPEVFELHCSIVGVRLHVRRPCQTSTDTDTDTPEHGRIVKKLMKIVSQNLRIPGIKDKHVLSQHGKFC